MVPRMTLGLPVPVRRDMGWCGEVVERRVSGLVVEGMRLLESALSIYRERIIHVIINHTCNHNGGEMTWFSILPITHLPFWVCP